MDAAPILALLGFCLIVALAARRIPGATIIGVLGVTAAGIGMGVSEWQGLVATPPDPTPTLLALDIAGALQVGMISVIPTSSAASDVRTRRELANLMGSSARPLQAHG